MKLLALTLRIIIAASLLAACDKPRVKYPRPADSPGDGYFWNKRTGQWELPGDKSGN